MTNCSIIVSSCDSFHDCWKPFTHAFNMAWPKCPYDKFIISNYMCLSDTGFSFLQIGEDCKWGDNLRKGLEQIDSEYIIYLQEDYWLSVKVRTSFIKEQLDYCKDEDLDYLRLTFPWMDNYKVDDIHTLSPTSLPYGICLQASIWRKDFLLGLLRPGMSGWDFEHMCNDLGETTFKTRGVIESVARKEFHYVDAVRKGRWTRIGYRYLKTNGFNSLIKSRKTEGLILTYSDMLQTCGIVPVEAIAKRITRLMRKKSWNF